ncbi:DUF72 domain-containing protein [Gorillibacterium sp. sgz5001074]|uniref:DUF72 domain-containing protein n=1 Tax=Gorillibacterium sp. sgz5001074 TaxID=3446695 RepID=UPI003F67FA76
MIRIGLAGWGDQEELYPEGLPPRLKLKTYAEHFPVVEVDSSFYAVQPAAYYERWVQETPEGFAFVVKAYQGMTGHSRGAAPFTDEADLFREFRASVEPAAAAGKLAMVLFQYPPWFDCTRDHVETLRRARSLLPELPLALEFRNRSWFTEEHRERTLAFMRSEGWIHGVCDEPDAGPGSVPTVLRATHEGATLVRFHGRNAEGWTRKEGRNWRDVRYLYDYSREELAEWADRLRELERESKTVDVIFNNNSGGHAAGNAKLLQELLGLTPKEPPPRQLDLF